MKLRIVLIAVLGLVVAFYLVMHAGVAAVVSAAAAVGWGGFAALCLYALGPFLILGAAWYVLLPDSSHARLKIFVLARMVRDAAAEVLPFSQLGGILIGSRAAILQGISQPRVVASTIVDVTTEMLAQIAYVALGIAILSSRTPRTSFTLSLTTGLTIGLVLAVSAGGVLLALQRRSRGMTARITARIFPGALAATAAVSDELDAIHGSPLRIGISSALHFAAWIASAMGAWMAFRLIGTHIDLAAVLAIESLICATRSIVVFIPNALGVQEAAYAVLSPLFGVGAEIGLAVSLLKRARDIAIGVPILLIWQGLEGRRALGRALPQAKTQ